MERLPIRTGGATAESVIPRSTEFSQEEEADCADIMGSFEYKGPRVAFRAERKEARDKLKLNPRKTYFHARKYK